jgi:tellurite resistance protein TerC
LPLQYQLAMFEAAISGWAITLGAIAGLVGFDLWQAGRNPHAVGLREAAGWSAFYIGVAVLFGVVFAVIAGWDPAAQYFAGYIVEKSLSVDNLFVFVVIMSTFAVPAEHQSRLLLIGIVAAMALRAVFIALGGAMIGAFSLTYLLFGVALCATALQLFRHRHRDPSFDDNVLVGAARRRGLPPTFLALVAIGSADLVFALDSIPAVFGVTQHAYIVFVANAFALLGLRALFFLVSGLLARLVYLASGLALILAFIGVKLALHFVHLHHEAVPEISTGLSLAVIGLMLATTIVASLIRTRARARAPARRGAGRPAGRRYFQPPPPRRPA